MGKGEEVLARRLASCCLGLSIVRENDILTCHPCHGSCGNMPW